MRIVQKVKGEHAVVQRGISDVFLRCKRGGVSVLWQASTVARTILQKQGNAESQAFADLKQARFECMTYWARQNTETGKTDLSRFSFQAFGAKDELLRELPES